MEALCHRVELCNCFTAALGCFFHQRSGLLLLSRFSRLLRLFFKEVVFRRVNTAISDTATAAPPVEIGTVVEITFSNIVISLFFLKNSVVKAVLRAKLRTIRSFFVAYYNVI